MKIIYPLIATLAFLSVSNSAIACSVELPNSWYSVSPDYDDGQSNATRVNCPEIGTLSARDLSANQPTAVFAMTDQNGAPLKVRDFAAITAVADETDREFEFSVVITHDYYVGFRFGSSASAAYFGEGSDWVGWLAVDNQNSYVQALRIHALRTNMDGEIAVELLVNNDGLVCTLVSDSELNFGSNWDCATG